MTADTGKKPTRFQDLAASSLGIEVAVATLLGGFLGWWLDGRFYTKPWLMLGGLVVGAVIGWVDVWLQIRNMDDADIKRKKGT
ncbi:MAG: AtpZ/AtpI family protein [Actinomycetota bacterium]